MRMLVDAGTVRRKEDEEKEGRKRNGRKTERNNRKRERDRREGKGDLLKRARTRQIDMKRDV